MNKIKGPFGQAQQAEKSTQTTFQNFSKRDDKQQGRKGMGRPDKIQKPQEVEKLPQVVVEKEQTPASEVPLTPPVVLPTESAVLPVEATVPQKEERPSKKPSRRAKKLMKKEEVGVDNEKSLKPEQAETTPSEATEKSSDNVTQKRERPTRARKVNASEETT